jgi:hypothetical protein
MLVGKMRELAVGLQVMNERGIVYQTVPDRYAIEYLMNRLLGRPTERNEITGKDGSDLLAAFERKARKIYGEGPGHGNGRSDDTAGA